FFLVLLQPPTSTLFPYTTLFRSAAALGYIDPLEERGDDLPQLGQHQIRIGAYLLQRMGTHAQQELLVRLPGAVDAYVRRRRRGQHAAQGVERLGPDRHAIDGLGLGRVAREFPFVERAQLREPGPVGVEASIERRHVALAERAGQLGRYVVAVPAVGAVVVGDVAGRLLQVGHEAAPLQDLGQDVRRALARQVHTPELGHRVVAVFDEP